MSCKQIEGIDITEFKLAVHEIVGELDRLKARYTGLILGLGIGGIDEQALDGLRKVIEQFLTR